MTAGHDSALQPGVIAALLRRLLDRSIAPQSVTSYRSPVPVGRSFLSD